MNFAVQFCDSLCHQLIAVSAILPTLERNYLHSRLSIVSGASPNMFGLPRKSCLTLSLLAQPQPLDFFCPLPLRNRDLFAARD